MFLGEQENVSFVAFVKCVDSVCCIASILFIKFSKMADSSLDEFFAKKDKSKKNKSKSKFTTSETIVKNLEEGVKRVDFTKKDVKEKSVLSSIVPSSNSSNVNEQDDEWKNIEDEKETDYSGLRIQALSISEKEKEEDHVKDQMVDHNGEMCRISENTSGPWKKVTAVIPTPPPVEEETVVEKPSEPEVPLNTPKPLAYKPPALRHSSSTGNSSNSRRHSKSAPQISSEVHFPTLSSAVDSKGKSGIYDTDRSFQSVKHGIKSKNENQHELHLDLENKFSALHQGDQF